jgi:hypothetical protein
VKKWFIVTVLLLVFYIALLFFFSSFLPMNKPVSGKLFIIEAWISPLDAETALPYLISDSVNRIIIVGKKYPHIKAEILADIQKRFKNASPSKVAPGKGIWMVTNSALAFNCNNFPVTQPGNSADITVIAKGTAALGIQAHFNLVVNGICLANAFVESEYEEFHFSTIASESGFESFFIYFDNDVFKDKYTDRNLNISGIKINGMSIDATEQNTVLITDYDASVNGFASQAEEFKNYIIQLGVDRAKIETVTFEQISGNQTLASARAFRRNVNLPDSGAVNILSSGLHSRRTWLTYQRILGSTTRVGVLNFEPTGTLKGKRNNLFASFIYLNDEMFSFLVTWIQLTAGSP